MTDTPITVTLPLTQTGAYVLLTALGIAAATGLVYLTLYGQEAKPRPNPAMDWLTALGWAMVPVWFTLLGGTLWHLWLLFAGKDSFLSETGFGMGAVVAAFLGGPFVIWGTVIKQKTVEFQKESHITERISKAVEQLGEEKTVKEIIDGETVERTVPNIEVRIGGLLSLERIAQDSTNYDKGRDHVRVMEILCAYLRENASASGARDFPLPDWKSLRDEATEEERKAHEDWRETRFRNRIESNAQEWAQNLPKPRADIALALQIIGRRTPEQRRVEARWGPDAKPDATWVFDTPCPELPEPERDKPHSKAVLNAYNADLNRWKDLIQSYRGYRLDLRGTNLQGTDLSGLILSGADLQWARMEGVNLYRARMEGADLYGARMDENTSLTAATLRGAAVREVNYTTVRFSDDQIKSCFGDETVTRPDGIARPDHWPDWGLPLGDFYDEWKKWRDDPDSYTPPEKPKDP